MEDEEITLNVWFGEELCNRIKIKSIEEHISINELIKKALAIYLNVK